MNRILLVLKHEVFSLTSRFSFWFGVFGIPVLSFVVVMGITLINRSQGGGNQLTSPINQVGQVFTEKVDNRPEGYIDQAGIISKFPDGFPQPHWIAYPTETEARAALDQGTIRSYYVIPSDYLKTGDVTDYMQQFRLASNDPHEGEFTWLLEYNLLKGDAGLTQAVRSPIKQLDKVSLAPADAGLQRNRDGIWSFAIPYAVMMLFYIAIMGSAGLLLNSVSKEKENRIMEVLLVSVKPYQLLLGKVLGLGIVGLLQVVIWMISAASLLTLSGKQFTIPPEVSLPPSLILWGAVFFVLGYLVYASLMAGLGALVPNLREASQATMVVVIPLMIPLFLLSALIENPDGPLAVAFSLFPLTAPTTMMLRLSATGVPIWQPVLSAVLLVITAYFVIRAVANMFRAQTILSGQPFKVKRFFLALAGKSG